MESKLVITTSTFLNKITENPWKHCAPYTFPYPRNYKGFSGFCYNDLKNLKKGFILDKLVKVSVSFIV